MFDWLTDVWNSIIEVFNLVCGTIEDLIITIDGVEFLESNAIFQFWGATRYVLGEPLYLLLAASITVGAGFIVYKLTVQIFDIVKSLIPGLAGKINFK